MSLLNPYVTFIFYSVIFGSGCFGTPRIPEGFELVIDIAVSFVFNLSGQENLIHSLFRTYWRMQRLRDVREALQLFCIIFPPQQKRQHIEEGRFTFNNEPPRAKRSAGTGERKELFSDK